MSQASKLNRHLRGYRRGDPKPPPVLRITLRPFPERFAPRYPSADHFRNPARRP